MGFFDQSEDTLLEALRVDISNASDVESLTIYRRDSTRAGGTSPHPYPRESGELTLRFVHLRFLLGQTVWQLP